MKNMSLLTSLSYKLYGTFSNSISVVNNQLATKFLLLRIRLNEDRNLIISRKKFIRLIQQIFMADPLLVPLINHIHYEKLAFFLYKYAVQVNKYSSIKALLVNIVVDFNTGSLGSEKESSYFYECFFNIIKGNNNYPSWKEREKFLDEIFYTKLPELMCTLYSQAKHIRTCQDNDSCSDYTRIIGWFPQSLRNLDKLRNHLLDFSEAYHDGCLEQHIEPNCSTCIVLSKYIRSSMRNSIHSVLSLSST